MMLMVKGVMKMKNKIITMMKSLLSVLLAAAIVLSCSVMTAATAQEYDDGEVTDDEIFQALAVDDSLAHFHLYPEQVWIRTRFELEDRRVIFEYRLIGSFTYAAVLYEDEIGKFVFLHGVPDNLYLYDRGCPIMSVKEAYQAGLISDTELDRIAERFASKQLKLGVFGFGFVKAEDYKWWADVCLYQYGDVDSDDKVSILDATLIQRALAGLTELSAHERKAADYDCDGRVTILDATMIQRMLAGLVDSKAYGGYAYYHYSDLRE